MPPDEIGEHMMQEHITGNHENISLNYQLNYHPNYPS